MSWLVIGMVRAWEKLGGEIPLSTIISTGCGKNIRGRRATDHIYCTRMVQIVRRAGFTRVEYGLRNVFPQGFPPFLLKILSRSQGRDLRSLAWQPQWSPQYDGVIGTPVRTCRISRQPSGTCTSVQRRSRGRSGCWIRAHRLKFLETYWRRLDRGSRSAVE